LEQEKKSLYEKLHAAKTNRYSIPFEKIFPFLEQEIQEKFKIKNQLSLEEEFDLDEKIDKAQDDMFGITKLKNQLDTIDKELEQLRAEPVWKKEKKARKKIYGYYSALDFAVCSGKSSYHRSIKNLLAMLSDDELKCKEAAKINEGLHNAYRNKKQS
jgi:hypothetical protein